MGGDPVRKSAQLQPEFALDVKRANDDDLRLLLSCWSAYSRRWVQQHSTTKTTHKQQKNIEAYLVDDAFELELANFHALVVHDVTSESALAYPRLNLEQRLRAWRIGEEKRVRGWWEPRSDQALACLADLQLVVPGVWIGSAVTLQHADAIARKKIMHMLHCVVADMKKPPSATTTTDASQQQQAQAPPTVQVATPLFPSTFAYTITLSELPQRECLDEEHLSPPVESDNTLLVTATWQELETTSKFLLGIVRLQDKFAASVPSIDPYQDNDKEDDQAVKAVNDVSNSNEMGLLLYCDSGVSASIAVCAALLMYRFCLPLRHAMQLLRSARRFIAPSPYLQRQLELYDDELRKRRQGLQRLSLHQNPA
ncbi:hypothetical protein Gpo141_00014714 [Globisporangium polare]